MSGHEVALAILTDGLPEPRLLAQCECGWRASFSNVITFTSVADAIDDHHGRALTGAVR